MNPNFNGRRRQLCIALFALSTYCCAPLAWSQAVQGAQRIDLIRHGESEDNPDKGQPVARLDGTLGVSQGKVLSGWNAVSLTMRGVAQAVRAGESLRKLDQDGAEGTSLRQALWLYSPLLRTRQTLTGVLVGADLATPMAARIRPDTRLFERSAGELTGLTWEEAGRQWPEMKKGKAAAVFHQAAAAYPRGESLELVYRRAAEALDEAIATEQRVVVISHELTLKALLAHLTAGKLDDAAFALHVENGRPISLIRRDGRWERLGQ